MSRVNEWVTQAEFEANPLTRAEGREILLSWNIWAIRAGVVGRYTRDASDIHCEVYEPFTLLDTLNLHAHGRLHYYCVDDTWRDVQGHGWTHGWWRRLA